MTTMNIPDILGVSTAVEKPNTNGRAAAANSRPTVLSTEDKTSLDAVGTKLDAVGTKLDTLNTAVASTAPSPVIAECPSYETVAASQTDQVMGTTGAIGDILSFIKIIPATTSPGVVQIKDGSGSAITVFTGGASSVTTLIPFDTAFCLPSSVGGWKITTGANVSVIAFGKFT